MPHFANVTVGEVGPPRTQDPDLQAGSPPLGLATAVKGRCGPSPHARSEGVVALALEEGHCRVPAVSDQ